MFFYGISISPPLKKKTTPVKLFPFRWTEFFRRLSFVHRTILSRDKLSLPFFIYRLLNKKNKIKQRRRAGGKKTKKPGPYQVRSSFLYAFFCFCLIKSINCFVFFACALVFFLNCVRVCEGGGFTRIKRFLVPSFEKNKNKTPP